MIEMYEQTITKLKKEAFDSWGGKEGEARSTAIESFIRQLTKNYSQTLGMSEESILDSIEKHRSYSAINYYQQHNFPKLEGDIEIFNSDEDYINKFPSKKFRCPACDGISTNPQTCNSGEIIKKTKQVCNWAAYGLLGTLGKGYRFIIKNTFLEDAIVYDIFKPIELENIKHE